MTLHTAVACGVLYLFGSGSLDEKAATLSMHKSTFDAAANRVIAELVERSNEVIYFPLKKEQAFLESRNVRWAVCHRRYSMQMRCEGVKKRLLLPKGVCLHQCANKVTGTIWYTWIRTIRGKRKITICLWDRLSSDCLMVLTDH